MRPSRYLFVTVFLLALVISCDAFGSVTNYYYVSTNGNSVSPYGTWADAATNLMWAAARAQEDAQAGTNCIVLVSNGLYGTTAELSITNGIVIQSVNGTNTVFVRRTGAAKFRVFAMTHPDAVLDGLVIANGYRSSSPAEGGGVYMTAGTVRNCSLVENTAYYGNSGASWGGGIYMTGGMVEDCVVLSNAAWTVSGYINRGYGGGIYMTGGTVRRCRILRNEISHSQPGTTPLYGGGGGVAMVGGTIENCLVAGNQAIKAYYTATNHYAHGGGVWVTGASCQVLNCTIVSNETFNSDSAGLYMTAGGVSNTIVSFNNRVFNDPLIAPVHLNVVKTGGSFTYSCATNPIVAGTGNIADPPNFVDFAAGDYRLNLGSPAIDAGTNLVSVSTDIEGNARPQDGDADGNAWHDMGAFETPSATNGELRCNFIADATVGFQDLDTTLTVYAAGSNTSGLVYFWDLNNDGTNDVWGPTFSSLSTNFGSGTHSISLTISNSLSETATRTRLSYITVIPATVYMSLTGTDQDPYDTWEKATSNLQAAVAVAGVLGTNRTTIVITNGTYYVTSEVQVTRGFTIRSVNGYDTVTVGRSGTLSSGPYHRVFWVSDPEALLQGLTVSNGYDRTSSGAVIGIGGGIYLRDGTVRECLITGNKTESTNHKQSNGGGIYMEGGLLTDCVIRKNLVAGYTGYLTSGYGAGVFADGGTVQNCRIDQNNFYNRLGGKGAGLGMTGGTARNCVIVSNNLTSYAAVLDSWDGSGLWMDDADALVENATICYNGNSSYTQFVGGAYVADGAVTNSIIYFNSGSQLNDSTRFGYCSATGLVHNPAVTGNITNAPAFEPGGYDLGRSSRCINGGIDRTWMADAVDIVGRQRIAGGRVDIGAYELPPPMGSVFIVR